MDRLPALGLAVEMLVGAGRLAPSHRLLLDGFSTVLLHGHDTSLLRQLVRSGEYGLILHGHTHRRRDDRYGSTRVINPGALGGIQYEPRSVCILDLPEGEIRFIELGSGR